MTPQLGMGVWEYGCMGVRASSAVWRTAAMSSGQRSLICDTTSGSCVRGWRCVLMCVNLTVALDGLDGFIRDRCMYDPCIS